MKLSFKQQQFLDLLKDGYKFEIGRNEKGWTVQGVTDVNSTLYLTITMRSLERRGVIKVDHSGVTLNNS